jgi:S-formylglutathione hydrolase FrmB
VFAGELIRLRTALTRAGHPPGNRTTPGAHSWSWANAQLPSVAVFLAQGWGRGSP